ncbi:MAG: substrate-binding domain-containing protein [Acidobacteriota bacterium]
MKSFRLLSLVTLIAGLALTAPACSQGAPSSTAPVDAKPKAAATDRRGLVIGLSMYTLGAPYFAAQNNALKRKAESLGITVIDTEAKDDMNKQLADVEDLLSRGIDLLILNPKDPQGLIPATKAATRAGVPVIIMDSSIDPSADFVTTVQSNNLANGELIGEWLVRRMKGKPLKIALLSGTPGNPVGKERRQGVFRGIIEEQLRTANRVSFEVVSQGWGNWAHEGGLKAMEDILVAQPDFNVMLAENDSMALGALKAIRESGRKDIVVLAAADGQKEALELIKKGEYGATGMNNPVLVAETALEMGLRYLDGERNFPKTTYTPAVCIAADNVDKYYSPRSEF